ncbi:MAG: DUF4159 domain-containing protein [Mariniblastus sp.]
MNRIRSLKWFAVLVGLLIGGFVVAQDYQRRWGGSYSRSSGGRNGVPDWENNKDFSEDVFTFVRIQYDDGYGGRGGGRWGRRGGKWRTDYPDADLNLSYRLKELTSLEVDPDGKIIRLTDESLFDYPFIYIIEPGNLQFSEEEVVALRRYLNKGGFLMVDDFWGEYEWENFAMEMKRVFPDRDAEEVPLEHEIFHIVYDLKKKPQIPSIGHFMNGLTTERGDAQEAHYRGIFDDKDRMMVFICHNTDLGDGWEREGVDRGYFETYSEPYAYPLGINIVTYALTH